MPRNDLLIDSIEVYQEENSADLIDRFQRIEQLRLNKKDGLNFDDE